MIVIQESKNKKDYVAIASFPISSLMGIEESNSTNCRISFNNPRGNTLTVSYPVKLSVMELSRKIMKFEVSEDPFLYLNL